MSVLFLVYEPYSLIVEEFLGHDKIVKIKLYQNLKIDILRGFFSFPSLSLYWLKTTLLDVQDFWNAGYIIEGAFFDDFRAILAYDNMAQIRN